MSAQDCWTRGEAINSARLNQLPEQKLFLYFNGERYATILAPDVEKAMKFGKSFGLKVEEHGLEEIPPAGMPRRKFWRWMQ